MWILLVLQCENTVLIEKVEKCNVAVVVFRGGGGDNNNIIIYYEYFQFKVYEKLYFYASEKEFLKNWLYAVAFQIVEIVEIVVSSVTEN